MAEPETDEEKRKHLHDLIKDFRTAMLVTRAASGELRSRPLAVAERRGEDLYFATSIDSGKVKEILAEPHVNVSMQSSTEFVSLSGTARVVTDRALISEMWSEAWKIWFPEGKADPSICLLAISILDAEYWDQSGTRGLRYLFQAAKAYVTGTRPEEKSAKVRV